ncbi:MAG: amidohydrolase family protein [FCB group bacterium]|nr:amidohydrolase family protein [FCB group bacterium]
MKSYQLRSTAPKICAALLTALLLIVFGVVGVSADQTTPRLGIRSKTPDARAFINARIIVSPEKVIENGTLVIKDGKVSAVGDRISVPAGVMTIDLKGKTIYPGFVESFSDYGQEKIKKSKRDRHSSPQYETRRIGGNAWNEAVHAEKKWALTFQPDKEGSKELMELGFTVSLSAPLDGIFRGRSCVALLGEGLPNDLLIRPIGRHLLSFSKGSSKQEYPSSLMGSIALIRQMFYDADWYVKARQVYRLDPNQKMPEFNAAIEAIAGNDGPIIFEGDKTVHSLLRAKRIGREFDIPIVHVASGREYSRLGEVKATGATLIVPLNFPKKPEIKTFEDELDLTLARLRHWETAPYNPARLEAENIPFALTTHRMKEKGDFVANLRKAIGHGLSEKTALAALTTVPAQICGVADMVGTLEEGKLANFFICDGSVFKDDNEIYSVWIAGHKNEINPFPTTEFKGQYRLNVGEIELELKLEGKPSKLKGEIKSGEWSETLEDVNCERNHINFSGKIDSLKSAMRFSGRKEDDKIIGRCVSEDGLPINWSAVRTGEIPEEADSTDASAKKIDQPLAKMTYPNMAYGWETAPDAENVLIKNATVWTAGENGILENTDVLIEDGKFAAVGKNLDTPAGFRIIDAAGKHVTPGIIDAHSHLAISGDVNEGTFAITPEVRIGDVINPENVNIYRQLSGGVTACLALHGSANPIGGQCQTIKLRWGSNSENMKFAGAAPTIKFAHGENVRQSNWGERFRTRYPQSRMGVETIIKDQFQAAREYENDRAKYRALEKNKRKMTIPPRRDLGLDALLDVINSKMLLHCHTYRQSETLMMMNLADEFGFTISTFVHVLEGYKLADEMVRHGATGTTFSDWWAYKFEVYDAIPHNASLMVEKGVVTTVNSDNIDLARRLNQEAGKSFLYGGISPEEAIKMVTINAAIQLGIENMTGSIEAGKDADFVIWNDYPLSIYARADQTWIDGINYFDRAKDRLLREEIKAEKTALINKILKSENSDHKGGGKNRGGKNRGGKAKAKSKHGPPQQGFGRNMEDNQ